MKSLMRLARWMGVFVALVVTMPVSALASPSTYVVPVGESRVYNLDRPIERVAVGNPKVADYIIINPTQLYLLGKRAGATNVILWDKNGKFTSRPLQVSRNIKPIRDMLKVVLPNEHDIQLFSWGPALVLSGTVSNAVAAETAYRLVKAYYGGKVPGKNPEYTLTNSPPPSKALRGVSSEETKATKATLVAAGIRGVVNLLEVRDPQQVRLEVRIAEISKSCLQELGLNWYQGAGNLSGSSLMSGFVSNATLNLLFKNGNRLSMDAECKQGLVKILAEPTIVTMNGQEGYFLVGGKVYTPTVAANGAVDYVERRYGVGLRFIPTVLEDGRISLKVAPEVSSPTDQAAAGLATYKLSYASTTVQMNEGQNLVIGGLLNDKVEETIRAVPVLSKLPILGALFRHTSNRSETTELVVVVRPTLVEATDAPPELPTDRFIQPTEKELFIDGKLEGSM